MRDLLPFVLGAASLGALVYGVRQKYKATSTPPNIGTWDERDVDAVARMLLIETSFRHDPDEMRGIIQVAINRAQDDGTPIRATVTPESPTFSWSSTGKWGDKFHNKVPNYPQYEDAKAFVRDYLQGNHPNRVAHSINMLHHNLMPICGGDCGEGRAKGGIHSRNPGQCYTCKNSSGRECVSVPGGTKRCLPAWSNEKHRHVYHLGKARFSAKKVA